MKSADVGQARARNLRLDGPWLPTAADVVAWHGAVQAQDYVPAKWSIAQRCDGLTSDDMDAAIEDGSIVRTHALRPTWHFIARDDARAIVGLTGPRLLRSGASRYRELGLDPRILTRAQRVVARALKDGEALTRRELSDVLSKSRVDVSEQRIAHLLMSCEFDSVICSGPRRGKDHTYALFDDRVPTGRAVDPADATRLLVGRYLASHGPATIEDMRWWSSLPAGQIRTALDELGAQSEMVGDFELWSMGSVTRAIRRAEVRLLETYDEYVVGYTRSRFMGARNMEHASNAWGGRYPIRNVVTRGGAIVGLWKRTKKATKVMIEVRTYEPLSRSITASLRREAKSFAAFNDLELELELGRI